MFVKSGSNEQIYLLVKSGSNEHIYLTVKSDKFQNREGWRISLATRRLFDFDPVRGQAQKLHNCGGTHLLAALVPKLKMSHLQK